MSKAERLENEDDSDSNDSFGKAICSEGESDGADSDLSAEGSGPDTGARKDTGAIPKRRRKRSAGKAADGKKSTLEKDKRSKASEGRKGQTSGTQTRSKKPVKLTHSNKSTDFLLDNMEQITPESPKWIVPPRSPMGKTLIDPVIGSASDLGAETGYPSDPDSQATSTSTISDTSSAKHSLKVSFTSKSSPVEDQSPAIKCSRSMDSIAPLLEGTSADSSVVDSSTIPDSETSGKDPLTSHPILRRLRGVSESSKKVSKDTKIKKSKTKALEKSKKKKTN